MRRWKKYRKQKKLTKASRSTRYCPGCKKRIPLSKLVRPSSPRLGDWKCEKGHVFTEIKALEVGARKEKRREVAQ